MFLYLTLGAMLCAVENELFSFSADFNQSIKDEHNKTITYEGSVITKRPNFALWHYKKPVNKKIYVYHDVVTVIEPEMEQAIIKRVTDNIDIFTIINNAAKIDANHAEAHYNDQKFLLTFNNNHLLSSIFYRDELDNKVTINFSKQRSNLEINSTLFKATIPQSYDIIK